MDKISGYYNDKNFQKQLDKTLLKLILKHKKILFVNIGTSAAFNDSIGPLIGTLLKESNINIKYLGDLDNQIHGLNFKEKNIEIHKKYKNYTIIAIDGCVNENKKFGYITIKNKPLEPGKGVNKQLGDIGDYSITISTFSPIINIDFTILYYSAKTIANSIIKAYRKKLFILSEFGAILNKWEGLPKYVYTKEYKKAFLNFLIKKIDVQGADVIDKFLIVMTLHHETGNRYPYFDFNRKY